MYQVGEWGDKKLRLREHKPKASVSELGYETKGSTAGDW